MGYDIFIRGNRDHSTYAEVADITPNLLRLGFKHTTGSQWILDDPDYTELYLSTVTEGPDGGDSIDGDPRYFNEVAMHPKPITEEAYEMADFIAAELGWEVYDPQQGEPAPDAGPQNKFSLLELLKARSSK